MAETYSEMGLSWNNDDLVSELKVRLKQLVVAKLRRLPGLEGIGSMQFYLTCICMKVASMLPRMRIPYSPSSAYFGGARAGTEQPLHRRQAGGTRG